jgi:putative endonuclease
MAKHNETGIKGEQIAENFLLKKGYNILSRNWCFERKEVDLIASTGDTLVFVEVKTRSSFDFGFPEEAVNAKKQNYLKLAAENYILNNPEYNTIRFDIISILMKAGNASEILHFEEAFY